MQHWIDVLEKQIRSRRSDINLDRKSSIEAPIGNGETLKLICQRLSEHCQESKSSQGKITELISVSFCGQGIDDEGFKNQILKNLILTEKSTIRVLHLDNEISNEGAKSIMEMLKSVPNCVLTELCFNDKVSNDVQTEVSKSLHNISNNKSALRDLQLKIQKAHKQISEKNIKHFQKLLEHKAESTRHKRLRAAEEKRSIEKLETQFQEEIENERFAICPKLHSFNTQEFSFGGELNYSETNSDSSSSDGGEDKELKRRMKGKNKGKHNEAAEPSKNRSRVSSHEGGNEKKVSKNNEKSNWKDNSFINSQIEEELMERNEKNEYRYVDSFVDPKKVY